MRARIADARGPMTSRRRFVSSAAVLPALLALQALRAAPQRGRVALVMGNAAYLQAPLRNPVNDANAMANLLADAGFAVDKVLDATQQDMRSAIERFTGAATANGVDLALFYYAGHGAQLEWKNYLLPVDARVDGPAALKQYGFDLGILLGRLSGAGNRTFVIILDACRDNPFGGAYAPAQKGLSQFDAPVNSLLAYATSPDHIAADGSGKNGLYTEHLVHELSERRLRLEDVLKRVRLKVRLASQGAQIPWESTSLESDVYLYSNERKLTDEEIEARLEADLAAWAKVRHSKDAADWTGYLLNFPNGHFAEIAQAHLNQLLAAPAAPLLIAAVGGGQGSAGLPPPPPAPSPAPPPPAAFDTVVPEKTLPAPEAVASNPTPPPPPPPIASASADRPVLEVGPGRSVPQLVGMSDNPHSAGRFPLARRYSVGDQFEIRQYDIISKAGSPQRLTVTAVDEDADRVELNGGTSVWDTSGNFIVTPSYQRSNVPRQFHPAELQIGRKWSAGWRGAAAFSVVLELRVTDFERVRVTAGEFPAFIVDFEGWDIGGNRNAHHKGRIWIVPGLNISIRHEHELTGHASWSYCHELVSLRQLSFDPAVLRAEPQEGR